MTEKENTDNLEQFFRKNLEDFSPEPSNDFWSRVEPAIPAKPSLWSGWLATAGKLIGLGLISGVVLIGAILWGIDRQSMAELSHQVDAQQNTIEELQRKVEEVMTEKENSNDEKNSANSKNNENTIINNTDTQITENNSTIKRRNNIFNSDGITSNNIVSQQINISNSVNDLENAKAEATINSKTGSPINLGQTEIQNLNNSEEKLIQRDIQLLSFLKLPEIEKLTTKEHALSAKSSENNIQKHLSKFSFEVGAVGFHMPTRQLFGEVSSSSTNLGSPPFQMGVLVNYQINSNWAIQSGFQFKNIRNESITARYNQFPFRIIRRWAIGAHSRVEWSNGLALNSLVNAMTKPEPMTISNVKSTFFTATSILAIEFFMNEQISMLPQTSIGYSLTPIANGRRTYELGIGAAIRLRI